MKNLKEDLITMRSNNVSRIEKVAEGLGAINEELVYVGGSVVEFYVIDSAKSEVRQTMDVDCVTHLKSYLEITSLEERLRSCGFQNDTTPGAPICRWVYEDEIVDIMPDDATVIGFTNRWYHDAVANKQEVFLSNGLRIWIFSLPYYIATKIEAVNGRGGADWRWSHDFEDLVYILNYNNNLDKELAMVDENLKVFFKEEFSKMLMRPNIREEIECKLPYGEETRVDYIIEIIKKLS